MPPVNLDEHVNRRRRQPRCVDGPGGSAFFFRLSEWQSSMQQLEHSSVAPIVNLGTKSDANGSSR
jgi:hypothetical protein